MPPEVIVITGASRGIGAATARLAAERGYSVCVNYRKERDAAVSVVSEITEGGGTARAIQADVSVEEDVKELFQETRETLGPVRALVNNAGVLESQMRMEEMDIERVRRVFATNFFGAFLCAREAITRMSGRNGGMGGGIVNVSSIAARSGSPGEYVDYAASKGALDSLTIGLAREVAGDGIRVNGVRPGFIHTEMHASGGEPDRVERVAPSLPMARGGRPEDVAAAILWLLSDEASFTTGSFIEVTGGR